MFDEIVTFTHILLGVMGTMFAIWVFVELLNAGEKNFARIKVVSLFVPILLLLALVFGGYTYLFIYPAHKKIILGGPWPASHNYFMETKEHVLFLAMMLGIYLPVVTRSPKLLTDNGVRILGMVVALLIVFIGLFLEGFGSIITKGLQEALLAR
jgi:hypothetical protein